jgi:hypothetical protein
MPRLSGDVRITGVINDQEFSASGDAAGDPDTGEYEVRLEYEHVPEGWHPLMYTDVKVSLLFHREEGRGKNFLTLADGRYTSAGTIDLGGGNILRNNTMIELLDERTFRAVYVMYGTAQTGELTRMHHFEETMLPLGPGRVAALALARWERKDGSELDALFSTRYQWSGGGQLAHPQFRKLEAEPSFDGKTFRSSYRGFIKHLPAAVEEGGPYIGHLIG